MLSAPHPVLRLLPAVFLLGLPLAAQDGLFPDRLDCLTPSLGQLSLVKTGESHRRVLFFTVYQVAHYVDALPGTGSVLDHPGTKAVTLVFSRDIEGSRIHEDFFRTLRERVPPDRWPAIEPSARSYSASFASATVRKGDQYMLLWLPCGTLLSYFNGQEIGRLQDPLFAASLWSVWVGENSVVNASDLLCRWPGPAKT